MSLRANFSTPTVRPPRNDEIVTASDGRAMETERRAANEALRILTREYPGYLWAVYIVDPMFRQDVLVIRNLTCDPRGKWGIVMRVTAMSAPDAEMKVKMAGGEFLERYNAYRGRIRAEEFANRIMHFARPEL